MEKLKDFSFKMIKFNYAINSGLKQDGVLSSFLLNQFIDDLISECVSLNIGKTLIGKTNTCIIVYADDIILIKLTF